MSLEVKKMEKNSFVSLTIVLVLVVLVSASSLTPALAETIKVDHLNALGMTVVDITGQPKMQVFVSHFDWGDNGAPRDLIRIFVWMAPLNKYAPVAYFTDSSKSVEHYQLVVYPYPTAVVLVNKWDIQVFRLGKTVFAYWTIPLVVPEETWIGPAGTTPIVTPAFTIPPGGLIFKGYGDIQTGADPPSSGPKYSQTTSWTGYFAHATLVCPKWHYCGDVGVSEGTYATMINTDRLVTTTYK
jgi:hypothetical protein